MWHADLLSHLETFWHSTFNFRFHVPRHDVVLVGQASPFHFINFFIISGMFDSGNWPWLHSIFSPGFYLAPPPSLLGSWRAVSSVSCWTPWCSCSSTAWSLRSWSWGAVRLIISRGSVTVTWVCWWWSMGLSYLLSTFCSISLRLVLVFVFWKVSFNS